MKFRIFFFFSYTRLVFSCRNLSHQNYLVICLILCSQLIFIPRFYLPNFIRLKISNKLKNAFFRTIFLSIFFFSSQGILLADCELSFSRKEGSFLKLTPPPGSNLSWSSLEIYSIYHVWKSTFFPQYFANYLEFHRISTLPSWDFN